MQQLNIPFQIEFFIQAIEANAYEIAFYLLNLHEEEIFTHGIEAVETHVRSYLLNKQFLKAKLHMSKCLLVVFNFNVAKQFLNIVSGHVIDGTLDGNFFAHSNNPLLNMCLLYELLLNLIKKFYSLNNQCRTLMQTVMQMMLSYIETVDDENFLTTVMLEKDYSGRDALRIAVELELLDLIQAPKVEGTIKRIYHSDFDQEGSLFEMSTSYNVVFGLKTSIKDPEGEFRFYKPRMIDSAL